MNAASRLREKTIPFEVKLKRLIANMHLNCIGIVADVNSDGSRINVNLPYLDCNNKIVTIKGVEVLRPGTNRVKVKIKPEVGDVVLLFAQQEYWAEATFAQQPTPKIVSSDAYNDNTIKALLVQTNKDNENATLIDIKEDEIEITTPLKTTIVCKDAVTITSESTTDITCKDAVTITAESTTDITCKDTVTVDASDKEVTVKASKVTINDHLEVT